MIAKADIRRVQEWMGHADIQTTMKYLHYAPRDEDAELVARAFQLGQPARTGADQPEDPSRSRRSGPAASGRPTNVAALQTRRAVIGGPLGSPRGSS